MSIAKIARKYNGVCTWTFSQNSPTVWARYRQYSWKGICAALSANWIKEHANEGSLANILGGGNVGNLDPTKLKQIGTLHQFASGQNNQEDTLLLWLEMHDIIPVRGSVAKPDRKVGDVMAPINPKKSSASFMANPRDHRGSDSGRGLDVPAGLVHALEAVKGKGYYAYITFGGTAFGFEAGHAVCAYIGQPSYSSGGDAAFFDPNYGEYWFEHKADFFRFLPEFYSKTYMSMPMRFNRDWSMQPLGKKMAAGRR